VPKIEKTAMESSLLRSKFLGGMLGSLGEKLENKAYVTELASLLSELHERLFV
jgi:hypothetical protein